MILSRRRRRKGLILFASLCVDLNGQQIRNGNGMKNNNNLIEI